MLLKTMHSYSYPTPILKISYFKFVFLMKSKQNAKVRFSVLRYFNSSLKKTELYNCLVHNY